MPSLKSSKAKVSAAAKNANAAANSQRCRYPNKVCLNQRAHKSNGALHRFCEYHRHKANQHQKRWQQRRLHAKIHNDDKEVTQNTQANPTTTQTQGQVPTRSSSLTIASPAHPPSVESPKKLKSDAKTDPAGSVSPSTPGDIIDDMDWFDLSFILSVPNHEAQPAPTAVKDVFSNEALLPVTWMAAPEPMPVPVPMSVSMSMPVAMSMSMSMSVPMSRSMPLNPDMMLRTGANVVDAQPTVWML